MNRFEADQVGLLLRLLDWVLDVAAIPTCPGRGCGRGDEQSLAVQQVQPSFPLGVEDLGLWASMLLDRQHHLVSAGGLVAGPRPPHLSGDLFRVDHRHPLWHSALQADHDCPGANRHESDAGAEMTYETF